MKPLIYTFERTEKKYLINLEQKARLLSLFEDRLTKDIHGESTICNIYLDTENHLLIRNSIDARNYKEKLRIRSYCAAMPDDMVFFEIKKKFNSVVYKRRVSMSLCDALLYIQIGQKPITSQIMSEIDYAMQFYSFPKPSMMIIYERQAFFSKHEPDLRITFDSGIRYRITDLSPQFGCYGKEILASDELIMEIKTAGAMPLWLSRILDCKEVFPSSFSKYAAAYRQEFLGLSTEKIKGCIKNVVNF